MPLRSALIKPGTVEKNEVSMVKEKVIVEVYLNPTFAFFYHFFFSFQSLLSKKES